MKIAALFALLVGYACAAPDSYLIDSKYDQSDNAQAQFDYDASSLPFMPRSSRAIKDGTKIYMDGSEGPSKLTYETAGSSNDETQAVVKRVSFESVLNLNDNRILNRAARSHDFLDEPTLSNEIPPLELGKFSENPTAEMYNDNFGGEHDSQESRIPDDALRSQHLYDGRALAMEVRNAYPFNAMHANPLSFVAGDSRLPGALRRIQHFQTIFPNEVMINPRQLKSFETIDSPRFQPYSMPIHSTAEMRSHAGFQPVPNGMESVPNLIPSPNRGLFSTYTNIVEYIPHGEQCKKGMIRKKRQAESEMTRDVSRRRPPYEEAEGQQQDPQVDNTSYEAFFADDLSRHGGLGPKIFKLKVRKGGVAIAGPGGIATAGSGGTAIVGPGGTAYTTQDGTAVVGPGGRVIEIPPNFPITKIEARASDPHHIFVPPGGKIIAKGPFVYYGRKDVHEPMVVHHGRKEDPPMFIPPIIERL